MNLEQQVEYYAHRAVEYERIYERPHRQEELVALKDWIRNCVCQRDVLEIACGTGYWTAVAAETASSIVALDINEPVLQIARSKPLPQGRVKFVQGDAFEPPPLNRRFSSALIGFWWSHVPRSHHGRFLALLQQVLLPGAVVLLFDNTWVAGESTPVSRTDLDGNTYQERRLENGTRFEILKNYPDENLLRAWLRPVAREIHFTASRHYWRLQCTWTAAQHLTLALPPRRGERHP